ncbi:MAG: diaminopropionate ammonia-lyase [Clostridia bacterium]|nr:diaminopropionate ammonia-lyase [Clostridia bacterium]
MEEKVKTRYVLNPLARDLAVAKSPVDFMSAEVIGGVRGFHKGFKEYEMTPLWHLKALADVLGLSAVYVKDESYRFGLNAFKVLGGAFAVGKYLAQKLNVPIDSLSFEKLQSDEVKAILGDLTFVTATDGNHGRGIAWAAKALGQKSVVFMPKGSAEERLANIIKEGAVASITDMNYDDAVRHAAKYADENNGVLIQDSAWDGYEEIPRWIMQGYATLMDEVMEQLDTNHMKQPTHLFLQAGVGSFASSMLGYSVAVYGASYPKTVIVEPDEAACIYKSAKIGDGNPHAVGGDMPTIMAGLACGEPSIVSWGILRDYADAYTSCPDELSALGMRILGNPLKGDPKVISGESGAVGMGLLYALQRDEALKDLKDYLNLNQDSVVLIISTEGDTDVDGYRKVVWEGAYSYDK